MNEQVGYNLGVYLYEMGEMKQAENAFLQQISKFDKISPTDKDMRAATFSYLADIQYNHGEYINAETNYHKSLNVSVSSMAYLGLGDVYSAQKEYAKAAEYYEKGIAYEPNRPSNIKRYNQLGLSYFYAEQYENARNAFNACISVMKENEKGPHRWRALSISVSGKIQRREATFSQFTRLLRKFSRYFGRALRKSM